MPDFALVATSGGMVLHEALCPVARQAANDGLPVLTMFGAQLSADEMQAQYDGRLGRCQDCLPDGSRTG